MPGSRYDRFYVDEMVKKYQKQDALDKLFESIKSIEAPIGEQFIDQFRKLVDSANYQKEQELKKEKEAKLAAEAS